MFIKKNYIKYIFKLGKKGLKVLYYCRSKSIQRAENVNNGLSTKKLLKKETKEDEKIMKNVYHVSSKVRKK